MPGLAVAEKAELAECEATIERGLETFVEVGTALIRIRDKGLYTESHGTFEAYCQSRWGMARRTAYQLISAAKVVENVRNCAHEVPATESQARPLTALKDPEQQREAWQKAVDTAPNGKVTGAHVQRTVDEVAGRSKPAPAAEPEEEPRPAPKAIQTILIQEPLIQESSEEAMDRSVDHWTGLLTNLWNYFSSLDRRGGIVQLARRQGWTQERIEGYVETIDETIQRFRSMQEELKGASR